MIDTNKINPFWKLADAFSVEQAAALIAGCDPNDVHFSDSEYSDVIHAFSDGGINALVQTTYTALINAINGHKLQAKLRYDAEPRYMAGINSLEERRSRGEKDVEEIVGLNDTGYVIAPQPNWKESTVDREDLVEWLGGRGFTVGFFSPEPVSNPPDYLDPQNPRYTPKLAAAVQAWQAVTDPGNRHPKQALAKWLRERAAKYGMTDEEGKLNEPEIDEIARIANWQPGEVVPKILEQSSPIRPVSITVFPENNVGSYPPIHG